MRAAAFVVGVAASLASPPIAHGDAVSCRRAIARASATYIQGRTKALARCEEAKTKGRIRPGDACAADPGTVRILDTLRVKLFADVNRACGGANRDCGDADDLPLTEAGWGGVPACPDLESSGCTNSVTTCTGVAICLQCIGARAVDRTVATATGAFDPGAFGTSTPVVRCQRAINKATSRFVGSRTKVLQRCWDARLRGRHVNPCPDPGDGKAVRLLEQAEARAVDTVCRACGGADRRCDGVGDLSPAEVGFAAGCPAVTTGDGRQCGGPVANLDDVVRCVDCVAAFATDCADTAAVPALAAYPTTCNAGGPATSTTTTSSPSTTTSSTSTSSTSTSTSSTSSSTTSTVPPTTTSTTTSTTTTTTVGTALTCGSSGFLDVTATLVYEPRIVGGVFGMFLEVDYPASVGIPGSGTASTARARFSSLIGTNYRFVASDLDSNADGRDDRGRTLVTANTSEPIPSAPIERVRFDCPAGTVVTPPQFACRPVDMADSSGQLFPPPVAGLITCTLSFAAP